MHFQVAITRQEFNKDVMPESPNALIVSSDWIAGTLTGTLGIMLAVLAIAGVGFAILQGLLAVRNGVRVVLGCFILFGAPAIAEALTGLAAQTSPQSAEVYNAPPPPPMSVPTPPPPDPDPYAGASVPL